MTTKGLVLEIQRMSTEDGPGIRTTVFLKGCSLACSWCHNPESISAKPELVWHDWRCIGCRTCLGVCPNGALSFNDSGLAIDRGRCQRCFDCSEECPSLALEVQGRLWGLDELVDELARDRVFYEASGGGVTISGGEPAMQPELVKALLDRCRELDLHAALDTCGHCPGDTLLDLAARSRLILYDLKEIDSERHRGSTGKGNERVLSNLGALARMIRQAADPPKLWIRTPLIPGATAREDNLSRLGALIARELQDVVERWELCAFNNLCRDKYRRLGQVWLHEETPTLTEAEVAALADVARSSGVEPAMVHATGPTRVEPGDVSTDDRPAEAR